MNTVSTPQGEVKLLSPTEKLLDLFVSCLPLGAVLHVQNNQGVDSLGIIIKDGERELYFVKQQPADCDEEQSKVLSIANSLLIANSLSSYLTHGFSGLLMPCAYSRTKDRGRFESGIAYFGYPFPQGRECQVNHGSDAWDSRFGKGFTNMMISFIQTLKQTSRDTNIPLSLTIGLDVRTYLQLGSCYFGYMLMGTHVICTNTLISEEDPTWSALRYTGITEVFYIPSVAVAKLNNELPNT